MMLLGIFGAIRLDTVNQQVTAAYPPNGTALRTSQVNVFPDPDSLSKALLHQAFGIRWILSCFLYELIIVLYPTCAAALLLFSLVTFAALLS